MLCVFAFLNKRLHVHGGTAKNLSEAGVKVNVNICYFLKSSTGNLSLKAYLSHIETFFTKPLSPSFR